jgi:adenylate cyclase
MDGNIRDYRHDLEYMNAAGGLSATASRYRPSMGPSNAQVAPWASDALATNAGGLPSGSFFDDGPGRLPASPSFRPDTARTGASDSPDPLFFGDERRPSMASATTVSSSNSNPRASVGRSTRHMKIANIFGDDGHDSSRGSDTNILATGHRDQLSSHSCRDRNNSINTINNDRRPISPASSRPRTPVPSSDVTPWLFQDFKVSLVSFR